jgi:hypothetical protein
VSNIPAATGVVVKFNVVFRTYLLIALSVFCFAGSQARASDPAAFFPNERPETISKQAFATPYFAALLEEFAKQVEKLGDTSCLKAKGLDNKALQERARRILVRHGEEMIQIVLTDLDPALFRQYEGDKTLAEIQRLEKNPAFTELAKIVRAGEIQATADWVVTAFNNYLVVSGYDWRGFSFAETGNPALAKFHDDERLDKLLNENGTLLYPYVDLKDKLRKEAKAALKPSVADPDRPSFTYFKGAEKDVAELCLRKK